MIGTPRVFVAKCESATSISGTIFPFTTHFEEIDMKLTTADSEGNILGTFDADDLLREGTGQTAEERRADMARRIDALREKYGETQDSLKAKIVELQATVEKLQAQLADVRAENDALLRESLEGLKQRGGS